jgi:hypothetical protein
VDFESDFLPRQLFRSLEKMRKIPGENQPASKIPFRHKPSATYFARLKVGGKSIRECLETAIFSPAGIRLADAIMESGKIGEPRWLRGSGKMSLGDVRRICPERLKEDLIQSRIQISPNNWC